MRGAAQTLTELHVTTLSSQNSRSPLAKRRSSSSPGPTRGPRRAGDGCRLVGTTELTASPPEREHEERDMRSAWISRTEFELIVRRCEVCDAQSLAAYTLILLHERAP